MPTDPDRPGAPDARPTRPTRSWRSSAGLVGCVLCGLLAVAVVGSVVAGRPRRGTGLDFRPVYAAAAAVLARRSVYDVPEFVYPPPAALLALPTQLLSYRSALHVAVAGELVAFVLLLSVPALSVASGRRAVVLVAGALTLFAGSRLAVSVTYLVNASVLCAVLGLAVVVAWSRGRWRAGAVVLGVSLVLKPLLVPLLVVPLLARRWREPVAVVAGAVAVSAVVAPFVAPLRRLPAVARHLLAGSNLVGAQAARNLTLRAFGQVHGVPVALVDVARLLVVLVVAGVLVVVARAGLPEPGSPASFPVLASVSGLVLVGLFLAGSLAESHYLLALFPAMFGTGWLGWRCSGGRRVGVFAALAVAVAGCAYSPRYLLGHLASVPAVQLRCVVAELALAAACAGALTGRPGVPRTAGTPADRARGHAVTGVGSRA